MKKVIILLFFLLTIVSTVSALNINTCQNLTTQGETYTLTNSVTSVGSCFNVTNSNITLDCNNYKITFGTSGGTPSAINMYSTNFTLKNCNIMVGSFNVYATAVVYLGNSNNNLLENNTIVLPGKGLLIGFNGYVNNSVFKNNRIFFNTSSSVYNEYVSAIYLLDSSNNTIFNNGIRFNHSSTYYHSLVVLEGNSYSNNVSFNTFDVTGITTRDILIWNYNTNDNSYDNVIHNNTIYHRNNTVATYSNPDAIGILVYGDRINTKYNYNSKIYGNKIYMNYSNFCFEIRSGVRNIEIYDNYCEQRGGNAGNSYGIILFDGVNNFTVKNNIIKTYQLGGYSSSPLGFSYSSSGYLLVSNGVIENNQLFSDKVYSLRILDLVENVTILNNNITADGNYAGVLDIRSGINGASKNIYFQNNLINNLTSGYGIVFAGSNHNNVTFVNNTVDGKIYFDTCSNSVLNFINTTYNGHVYSTASNCIFNNTIYMDLNITSSKTNLPISSANVILKNSSNDVLYTGLSNSNGNIGWLTVNNMIFNSTHSLLSASPFSVSISKTDYIDYNENFEFNNSGYKNILLNEIEKEKLIKSISGVQQVPSLTYFNGNWYLAYTTNEDCSNLFYFELSRLNNTFYPLDKTKMNYCNNNLLGYPGGHLYLTKDDSYLYLFTNGYYNISGINPYILVYKIKVNGLNDYTIINYTITNVTNIGTIRAFDGSDYWIVFTTTSTGYLDVYVLNKKDFSVVNKKQFGSDFQAVSSAYNGTHYVVSYWNSSSTDPPNIISLMLLNKSLDVVSKFDIKKYDFMNSYQPWYTEIQKDYNYWNLFINVNPSSSIKNRRVERIRLFDNFTIFDESNITSISDTNMYGGQAYLDYFVFSWDNETSNYDIYYVNLTEENSQNKIYVVGEFQPLSSKYTEDYKSIFIDVCNEGGLDNIDKVIIEINGVNETIGNYYDKDYVCRRYNKTSSFSANSYNYVWYVNDTLNNLIKINNGFVINKTTPTINIYGITNGTYPIQQTIYYTVSTNQVNSYLSRNGTSLINNTQYVFSAGLYNITAYTIENQNYTANYVTIWNLINKATPNLYSSVTTPITYETALDYFAYENNNGDSDLVYVLYRNGTQISTGSSVNDNTILKTGYYNYTYATSGGENYTSNYVTNFVTVNKAIPKILLYGITNGTYPIQQTIYYTLPNQLTGYLVKNGSVINNNTVYTFSAGLYNITAYTNGNENYTSNYNTSWCLINKGVTDIILYLNNTDSDRSYYENQIINITGVSNVSSLNVYLSLNATGYGEDYTYNTGKVESLVNSSNLQVTKKYEIKAKVYENENYTSDEDIRYIYISDTGSPSFSNIINSPASGVEYLYGRVYVFNSTWIDDGGIDVVLFGLNTTPTEITTKNGDVYYVSKNNLKAGNYTIHLRGNDTSGNYNMYSYNYEIKKNSTISPNIYLNVTETYWVDDYKVECNFSDFSGRDDLVLKIYRNNTFLSSSNSGSRYVSNTDKLPSGFYVFKCNSSETENYTSTSSQIKYLTIKKYINTTDTDLIVDKFYNYDYGVNNKLVYEVQGTELTCPENYEKFAGYCKKVEETSTKYQYHYISYLKVIDNITKTYPILYSIPTTRFTDWNDKSNLYSHINLTTSGVIFTDLTSTYQINITTDFSTSSLYEGTWEIFVYYEKTKPQEPPFGGGGGGGGILLLPQQPIPSNVTIKNKFDVAPSKLSNFLQPNSIYTDKITILNPNPYPINISVYFECSEDDKDVCKWVSLVKGIFRVSSLNIPVPAGTEEVPGKVEIYIEVIIPDKEEELYKNHRFNVIFDSGNEGMRRVLPYELKSPFIIPIWGVVYKNILTFWNMKIVDLANPLPLIGEAIYGKTIVITLGVLICLYFSIKFLILILNKINI